MSMQMPLDDAMIDLSGVMAVYTMAASDHDSTDTCQSNRFVPEHAVPASTQLGQTKLYI